MEEKRHGTWKSCVTSRGKPERVNERLATYWQVRIVASINRNLFFCVLIGTYMYMFLYSSSWENEP